MTRSHTLSLVLLSIASTSACGGESPPPPQVATVPSPPDVPAAAAPSTSASASPSASTSAPMTPQQKADALAAQADAMQMTILAAGTTRSDASPATPAVPPVDLSGARATPSASSSAPTRPRVDVSLGGTTATVPVPNADRVLAGLRPRFRNCYQKGLDSDPTMSGRLAISVRVAPSGEVLSASMVSNTGLSPGAADCVVRAIKATQFEVIGGAGSTLTLPIVFVQAK